MERDSRVLSIALEALMKDFEPRDAIPYMCSRQIINDDQQEAILRMVTIFVQIFWFLQIKNIGILNLYRKFSEFKKIEMFQVKCKWLHFSHFN